MFKEAVVLVDFGDLLVWFTRLRRCKSRNIEGKNNEKKVEKFVEDELGEEEVVSLLFLSLPFTLYLCKEMTHYGFIIHMKKGKDLFLVVLKEASSSQQSSIIV